jgi:hypothetical protein
MVQEVSKENEFITLRIPKVKFNLLLSTIKAFTDGIYNWGFDKFFEKKLLEDLKTMRCVLEENKIGG